MDTKEYETRTEIKEKVLEIYSYGSRVYGCNTESSDFDYIVVIESDEDIYYSVDKGYINCTVYSEPLFIKKIQEHHISIMECIFQFDDDPYLKHFELDTEKLRRAISSVSSNSYVKCKKKLREGDTYIGKKSLFHSIRILDFGIQIATYGKIRDYSSANNIYDYIMRLSNDWEELHHIFKPMHNDMKSIFKKLAPLESEKNEEE